MSQYFHKLVLSCISESTLFEKEFIKCKSMALSCSWEIPWPHTMSKGPGLLKRSKAQIPVLTLICRWQATFQLHRWRSCLLLTERITLSHYPGVLTFNMLAIKAAATLDQSSCMTCPGLLLWSHHVLESSPRSCSGAPGQMQTKKQGICCWKVEVLPCQILP